MLKTTPVIRFDLLDGVMMLTVWTEWYATDDIPLDRPITTGMNFGPVTETRTWSLARRYSACILAQKAYDTSAVKRDIDGQTYVQANSLIYGKRANADLRRLGF